MRYFTPELYVQGNSPDDALVSQAEQEWERATARYRRHYRKIKPQLPESLRKFHDEYCLHDADVFGPARLSISSLPWSFQDVVIVAQNEFTLVPEHLHTLMFLQYAVTEEPRVEIPVPSEVFNEVQPIWLYDELDVVEPGVYSHEILLSNGRVIRLRFREFHLHVAPLVVPYKALNLKTVMQGKVRSA